MKRLFSSFIALTALFLMTFFCCADEAKRLDISILAEPSGLEWAVNDDIRYTKQVFTDGGRLTISCEQGISALYFVWDAPAPESLAILANGRLQTFENGFIHELITLESPANEIIAAFKGNAALCDIYAFSEGKTPDWVQSWVKSDAPCDILFLPTHADDEMLYFGGVMALAAERESEIQVAYMVNHNGEYYRPHELLDGLWELGVRRYPIIPDFPDVYSWSHEHAKTIYDESEILTYQTELIDRFKPQIIIGHDLNGEYGHGAHILNSYCLLEAVNRAEWQTKKLYLHLYGENSILLNGDEPLEHFGGATVFEMAVRGFACHKSQQQFFTAEQSGPYDMRKFGLYHSTVGADSGNDIFENITLYRDMKTPERQIANEDEYTEDTKALNKETDSTEKLAFLPEAESDNIFVVLGAAGVLSFALASSIAAVLFLRKR